MVNIKNVSICFLVKKYIRRCAKNLGLFFFMFGHGVIESMITYLLQTSRDYRYITYFLKEEKGLHKQMMNENATRVFFV